MAELAGSLQRLRGGGLGQHPLAALERGEQSHAWAEERRELGAPDRHPKPTPPARRWRSSGRADPRASLQRQLTTNSPTETEPHKRRPPPRHRATGSTWPDTAARGPTPSRSAPRTAAPLPVRASRSWCWAWKGRASHRPDDHHPAAPGPEDLRLAEERPALEPDPPPDAARSPWWSTTTCGHLTRPTCARRRICERSSHLPLRAARAALACSAASGPDRHASSPSPRSRRWCSPNASPTPAGALIILLSSPAGWRWRSSRSGRRGGIDEWLPVLHPPVGLGDGKRPPFDRDRCLYPWEKSFRARRGKFAKSSPCSSLRCGISCKPGRGRAPISAPVWPITMPFWSL